MKRTIRLSLFFLCFTISCVEGNNNCYIKKDCQMIKTFQKAINLHLRSNLNKNHYLLNTQTGSIPKIIHFIWLGPNKIPEVNQECIKSWYALHPDWDIRLWTDKDIEYLDLDLKQKILLAENYGMKSDILRYELLKKFGGIYIDVDTLCIKNFGPLVKAHDFFAGIFFNGTIMNGLIASKPNHPLLKVIVDKLIQNELNYSAQGDQVQIATGPNFFTNTIKEYIVKHDYVSDIIIYPPNYFYPNSIEFIHMKNLKEIFFNKELLNKLIFKNTFTAQLHTRTWESK